MARLRQLLHSIGFGSGAMVAWLAAMALAHRAVFFFRPARRVRDPVEAFFFEANDTTPQILYGLFAFLVWRRRHAIQRALRGGPQPLLGGLFLALGVSVYSWATYVWQIDLLLDAFVLLTVGSALLIGGTELLGSLVLPLAVLWLARPLPPVLLHYLHHVLQDGTATFAETVVGLFGMTTYRSGNLIDLNGRVFAVVESCSGMRIIQTLIMAALVYADLFSRRRSQTIALVLLAPLIGFVVNGFRVVIVMLNPWSEIASVHSTQGLVMIVIGVLLLAGLDTLGKRFLWGRAIALPTVRRSPPRSHGSSYRLRVAAANLAALAILLLSFRPPRAEPPQAELWKLERISPTLAGWSSKSIDLDPRFLGTVRFRDKVWREYQRGDDRVQLFVGADDRRRRDRSGHSPKTRLLRSGWEETESESHEIDLLSLAADRVILRKGREQQLALHWRFGAGSVALESLRWLVAYDLYPRRSPHEIVTVRVSTEIEPDEEAAMRRLDSFLEVLRPALQTAAPAGFQFEAKDLELSNAPVH